MINKPSIDKLNEKTDSVYTLVILAALRAKQINDGADLLLDEEDYQNDKPVTRSLDELVRDKIKYKKNTKETYK
ncbi:MAG: DNA-directed RNA polymerase subunit omega [Halanaerobiaceae bacterium]